MELDAETCYRALRTRDPRFDGRFFTAVVSTGVYCRPVCPALTPRLENCRFLPCAAAAQEAGFRPCLRCRPEASPGTPAWLGTSATVSRALRLISEGALDRCGVEALAARLGIGERHLRRLFAKHLGASPLAVALTRRILFAKKLIDETALPFTQVALASGFSSLRRFNDAIARSYRRTPRELRRGRRRASSAESAELTLILPYRPPLDWDALIGFLRPRATPGVEAVEADVYRRTVTLDGAQGEVEVRPVAGRHHLLAKIRLSAPTVLIDVTERLRRLFDLGADPGAIAQHLGRNAQLAAAVTARPGLRIPGAWDSFELAVRAIVGQQVSVAAATRFAGRLAEAYGEPVPTSRGLERLFPTPEALAAADLSSIGLTRARAHAVAALAAAVARKELTFDASRGLDATVRSLRELPGVGEWTAQYIALRALGEPDAFPASDLGLRRALARGGDLPDERQLAQLAEAWRPWRGYAAMYLWTSGPRGAGSGAAAAE
ncbi:MAG: AlkA N-terminal domain-containing protein [Myxococcota bacterium]